jgi:hypothetical protein
LNRLQLREPRMMVDLNADEPVDSLQFAGDLQNPIAAFRDASIDRLAPAMENLHGNY